MNHKLIIWILILFIVIFQIYIFIKTKEKIISFRKILENPEKFKTYKVFIPEDEIENIDSELIINNIDHYKKNPILYSVIEQMDENKTDSGKYSIIYKRVEEDINSEIVTPTSSLNNINSEDDGC
jgi:hypothetical protein